VISSGLQIVSSTENVWLDANDLPEQIKQTIIDGHFSRLPMIRNSPDNIVEIQTYSHVNSIIIYRP